MKLLVNTIDSLQAIGLTTILNQYTPVVKDAPYNTVGVVFDNKQLLCAYIPAGANATFDKKVDASIGIPEIVDLLLGVEGMDTYFGSVVIRPDDRTVELQETRTLTFDDIETIWAKIHPNESDEIVTFNYSDKKRVVILKTETRDYIEGLDICNDFKFKKFLKSKIQDLTTVR